MAKLLFFADLAESLDKVSETISLPPEVRDVRGLVQWLHRRGAVWAALDLERTRVLVNRHEATPDTAVGGNDEIAFIPHGIR